MFSFISAHIGSAESMAAPYITVGRIMPEAKCAGSFSLNLAQGPSRAARKRRLLQIRPRNIVKRLKFSSLVSARCFIRSRIAILRRELLKERR
jgi:hypothetical protein